MSTCTTGHLGTLNTPKRRLLKKRPYLQIDHPSRTDRASDKSNIVKPTKNGNILPPKKISKGKVQDGNNSDVEVEKMQPQSNSVLTKKLEPLSTSTGASATAKRRGPKPKYIPDSMSKMTADEISKWRREQRQERNRACAAATVQRQREYVQQLQRQIIDYRSKCDSIQQEIRHIKEMINDDLSKMCND